MRAPRRVLARYEAQRRNVRLAAAMLVLFVLVVLGYSAAFHHMMALEGREFPWSTSIYWTLVTMSTLGYGDIVFKSQAGHAFTLVVLITGAAFILVLLPFVLVQFLLKPWLDRRAAARVPRRLGTWADDHIVLTGLDPVSDTLVQLAEHEGAPYVLLVTDLAEALQLHDRGYRVMLGDLDDPATYRNARIDKAALVVTTQPDTTNTNVAFTVREISRQVTIVATADSPVSVPVLKLAGCTEVLQLGQTLGRALARRVSGVDNRTHVVGELGDLRIVEANVSGTTLVGETLAGADLRGRLGVDVLGVRERGVFSVADSQVRLSSRSILLMAGTDELLAGYDETFAGAAALDRPVLVIGGGRVGRAAAAALEEVGIRTVIVEKQAERIRHGRTYVQGDAAEIEVLERAGLREAAAVLVTTREDDVNIYLTLYLRRLRPELQLIARATRERNVSTLYRAGADAVLSYASIGAAAAWNTLGWRPRLIIAEGVDVFRTPVPRALRGRSPRETDVEQRTGCRIVAILRDGAFTSPDRSEPLHRDTELIIIGDEAAEQRFIRYYAPRGR